MSILTPPTFDREIAQYWINNPIQLLPAVSMSQEQFFDFCQQNRKLRFERTAEGELIVIAPTCGESGIQNSSIVGQLYQWATFIAKKGKVLDSNAGFILANNANRSPDASWISPEQWATITPEQRKKFLPICPFFLVELVSPSDSLKKTQEKLEEYIANGCQLGWLIDPERKQVHVYRPKQPAQVFDNLLSISADPELPGFVLDLKPVWQP